MKILLQKPCAVLSCSYHSQATASHCIWEYASSRSSLSPTEIALLLGVSKETVLAILCNAKHKLIRNHVQQKLTTTLFNLNYCNSCGRTYNLIQQGGAWRCIEQACRPRYTHLETLFNNKPISHILVTLANLLNVSTIAKLLNMSTKHVREMYKDTFGNLVLLSKNKKIGG